MLETLLSEWITGPRAKAFEEDQKEAELAERKRRAAEKAEAQKRLDRESPALIRTVESILADRELIKKRHAEELLQVEKRLEPARYELANLQAQCRRIIDGAEDYLTGTASPRIQSFADELIEQRKSLSVETRSGLSIDHKVILTHSNYDTWRATVDRINEILCRDLKSLALQPLTDAELDEAINELRESIPKLVMKKIR